MEIYQGKEYRRVSEILEPFSGYGHVPPFVLDKAKERGDAIHRHIECDLLGLGIHDVNPLYMGYIKSYQQFALPGKVMATERRFYDKTHMLTGKSDLFVELADGHIGLIDWKTSLNENATWPIQGSAYAWLARQAGIDVRFIAFVKLNKKGGAPKVYEYPYDPDTFFKCYDIYKLFFEKPEAYVFED